MIRRAATLTTEIAGLNKQIAGLNRRDKTRRSELQKQLATQQAQLGSNDERKKRLHELYSQPDFTRASVPRLRIVTDAGERFPRPGFQSREPGGSAGVEENTTQFAAAAGFKLMEEVATAYQRQFDRPLPVSSLVRPEQYQGALRRVNRGAAVIETPPHSTGLAFDIDYRYMSTPNRIL